MIEKTPAKIVGDKLELVLDGKTVQLTRLEVLRLRITLNAYVNGDLEEVPEDEE